MSELLRALMTERCLNSRPKWYQILSGLTAEPVSAGGVVLTGNVQIQVGTYFMCMAVTLQEGCNTNFASGFTNLQGVQPPSIRNAALSLYDADTSYAHQSNPVHIQTLSYGMNSITDMDDYFVIEGSHILTAAVTALPLQVVGPPNPTTRQWATTLVGVEFKFDKPINIDDYKALSLAYRPPPVTKHADFYPLLSGA